MSEKSPDVATITPRQHLLRIKKVASISPHHMVAEALIKHIADLTGTSSGETRANPPSATLASNRRNLNDE